MSDPRPVDDCKRCGQYCEHCWSVKANGDTLASLLLLTALPISVGVLTSAAWGWLTLGVIGLLASWEGDDE